ncbi:hypothetical protein FRUB_02772 [Fimbriiglobus ruber]|uniref:ATP-grasp domain-containing protein n=1 Tax=Fimbriiglobus ruber TaxID=1908690 RepID=A0A225DPZ0_9BACT|nr:hypothetical protein FRUB_02772 [Fimbriiglobus ruber]
MPPGTGIRDKVWQRLVVEEMGHLSQPGFAVMIGSRVEGCSAPWLVRVGAVDCRPTAATLRSAAVPGAIIVVEGVDAGFAAEVRTDGVRVVSRNSHVAARLNGAAEHLVPLAQWNQFVSDLCEQPLPLGITKAAYNPAAELGDALRECPGSYILKPRYGSNGVGVVRIVSHADGSLTAESDCPDTALYLEEFPHDPRQRGRDVIAAAATHRPRFVDRASAGLPEWAMGLSILEEEIRQDRADGSLFEPRIVVQRMKTDSGETFAIIGAICKRIDTSVGASVARDFREEPLDVSLGRFLRPRVPSADLTDWVRRVRNEIFAAGERVRDVVVPLVEARGARIHQFGIDCRLCWNQAEHRVAFPFLEFQFGIGRIDQTALDTSLVGYQTGEQLRSRFGPETG